MLKTAIRVVWSSLPSIVLLIVHFLCVILLTLVEGGGEDVCMPGDYPPFLMQSYGARILRTLAKSLNFLAKSLNLVHRRNLQNFARKTASVFELALCVAFFGELEMIDS